VSIMTPVAESMTPNASLREIVRYARQMAEATEQMQVERARVLERVRGIKDMTYRIPPFTAATSLTIQGINIPVDQGFSLNLKMITGKLSAADTVVAYLGESNTGVVIGAATGIGSGANLVFLITWTSSQKVLKAGESVFLQAAGAGNLSDVTVMGVQVPAEEIGKIIS